MAGPVDSPPGVRQRLVEAAYGCVARSGFAGTTVEEVSRAAGVSRATCYRYFPGGRDELLAAAVAWEHGRFFARLYEEVADASTVEEVMVAGLRYAHRAIAEHEVLQRVLASEPGVLLPKLTVEAAGAQRAIAAFLRPSLDAEPLAPGVDVDEAADFLSRMVLSFISAPGRWDLDDPDQLRRLVRAELLGGILAPGA